MRTISRRIAYVFAILTLLAAPAVWAQATTAVTGTITDPNGLPYSGANINVQLAPAPSGAATCGGSTLQTLGHTTASATGFFQINLCPNASITPAGSQWQFNVQEPGVQPPIGTGPQSFRVLITISGASQSVSAALSAVAPALSQLTGGGAGVSSLNALTGAVTLAGSSSVTITPSGNTLTFTSTSSTTPGAPTNSIQFNNAGAFGGNAGLIYDPTGLLTGSSVVLKAPTFGTPPATAVGLEIGDYGASAGTTTAALQIDPQTQNNTDFAIDVQDGNVPSYFGGQVQIAGNGLGGTELSISPPAAQAPASTGIVATFSGAAYTGLFVGAPLTGAVTLPAASQAAIALNVSDSLSASSTFGTLSGEQISMAANSAGSTSVLTNLFGLNINLNTGTPNTIQTNSAGVNVNFQGTADGTNVYGFHVQPITPNTGTTAWGFYADNANEFFGGSLTLGGPNPAATGLLTFKGNTSGSAAITVAAAAGTPNPLVLPIATGSSGQFLQTNGGSPQQLIWATPSAGTPSFPLTVAGTVNSGGIPCFTSTTTEASSATFAAGVLPKGGGSGACVAASSVTDNGTTVTSTDTGGYVAPVFQSNGTTAGFIDFPQGSSSAAVAPCNTATSICEQAPTAVTSYLVTKPGVAANGLLTNNVASSVDTQGFSGDSNHSTTVTISSATSISSTSLCSTANCPVGTYQINGYLDVTTACTTTGGYFVSIIYTDDAGSKTVVMPLIGTGVTASLLTSTGISSSLALSSTSNFAQGDLFIRSTGAVSINYSTTASACATGGPAAGKLYLSVVPVQ